MKPHQRVAAGLAGLLVSLGSVADTRADIVTLDLPELIGVHDLGPSSFIAASWADFVVDFNPLVELTIHITATGVPGSLGGNPIPAALEVDIATLDGDVIWNVIEGAPIGPFGPTPITELINFTPIPGDDGGRYPGIYEVILMLPDSFGEYDTPAQVHITAATITAEFTPIGRPCYCADIDGDGFIGIGDLNLLLSNWNSTIPPGDPRADPSGDAFVGIDDLNLVLGNWNAGTPPTTIAVPEPGTFAVLSLGLTAILGRHNRWVKSAT